MMSPRRKTHCSQKALSHLELVIKKIHSCLSRLQSSGDYQDGDHGSDTFALRIR